MQPCCKSSELLIHRYQVDCTTLRDARGQKVTDPLIESCQPSSPPDRQIQEDRVRHLTRTAHQLLNLRVKLGKRKVAGPEFVARSLHIQSQRMQRL